MSSLYVRENILAFSKAQLPSETIVDLTEEFEELGDLLEYNDLTPESNWVGVHFVGSDEIPVDIRATNDKGTYREQGVFYVHVVAVARIGGHNDILTRAETIRDKFRGQRIGSILIESVSPPNFGNGASIDFAGGFSSASFIVNFYRDFSL